MITFVHVCSSTMIGVGFNSEKPGARKKISDIHADYVRPSGDMSTGRAYLSGVYIMTADVVGVARSLDL